MRNVYRQFLDLLPSNPLQVGEVISIEDGLATIELPGGGLLQGRGDAAIGDRVFIRGGVIEGAAPTLDYVEFDL